MDHFNPETALQYATAISHPRLVGTVEENVIRDKLASQMEQIGLQVNRQPFQFSTAMEVLLVIEICLGQLLILAAVSGSTFSPTLAILCAIALVVVIAASQPVNNSAQKHSFADSLGQSSSFWSRICWNLGKRYATSNIVGMFPEASRQLGLPQLFLMAHYDSISQRIPLVARVALFTISIGGGLLFAGLIVLSIFFPALTAPSYALAGLVILGGIPLLRLEVGNMSPGAIDDASGVGVVLHLAEIVANRPDIRNCLNVTVLLTGAEELGTMGALAYVLKNKPELEHLSTTGLHVLNFDGPGSRGSLYMAARVMKNDPATRVSLQTLMQAVGSEHNYAIGKFGLVGALFDHLPFADAGCDAATLMTIGKNTLSVHSAQDSADKLDVRGFEQAGTVALGVIEKLVAAYQPHLPAQSLPVDNKRL